MPKSDKDNINFKALEFIFIVISDGSTYQKNIFSPKKYTLGNKYTVIYNNIHTTSTECQYQIAHSKETWSVLVKWPINNLIEQTIKKIDPIITWNPWKPVNIKKTDPKTPSFIAIWQNINSCTWIIANAAAIIIVRISDIKE